jgi:phosphate transport system protein
MKIHLQKEIDHLKKQLFHLSSLVEESIETAIRAVAQGDAELAGTIRLKDKEIDRLEVEVEEECLKILALHQPVATDLRFLVAVLKMNNDLERIGDLAVNIASGKSCLDEALESPLFGEKLGQMGRKARLMLRQALEALMNGSDAEARAVLAADDEVDADYYEFIKLVRQEMAGRLEDSEAMICWMMVAKHVERVADLATNIAEDTIYTVTGEIVRHGRG